MTQASTAQRVAIVLVNWNGWRDGVECLSSLLASDAMDVADIWLVDNDSADGSIERIAQWCDAPGPVADYRSFAGVSHVDAQPVAWREWTANGGPAPLQPGVKLNLVRAGRNGGFAAGNNVGITAAGVDRYSHFWLLNTDTVVAQGALQALLRRAQAEPDMGMVGSTLLFYAQPGSVQALGGGRLAAQGVRPMHIGEFTAADAAPAPGSPAWRSIESEMDYVIGASMLVSSDFLREVGPMCEDYFLYFEELDWSFRSRPRWRLGFAPDSRVFHKVGASSAQSEGEFSLRLLYQNQVRFVSRFLPGRLPALKRRLARELLGHIVRRRWMPARLVAQTLFHSKRIAASRSA